MDYFIQAAEFFDTHNGAFTALFTIGLAISTILLWRATRNAALGSERAANIAEQALTQLERPFVFVKDIDLFTERTSDTPGTYGGSNPGAITAYIISVVLENGGQSPAIRMTYNFNCGHVTAHNIETFEFPDQKLLERGVLGPKGMLQTKAQTISAASMSEVVAGVDRWFIWGWADYDDIFNDTKRHRTEFCFEVKARRLPNGQTFVGFPMHGRFNATDDDCLRKPGSYSSN